MADIQHSVLTDPELHEPKGASTATDGQVYVADGAGSGAWTGDSDFVGTSGYDTLPSGLIIQWGTATSQAGEGVPSITTNFPTAFPTACLSLVATKSNVTPNAEGDTSVAYNATQYGIRDRDGAYSYNWLAVGH